MNIIENKTNILRKLADFMSCFSIFAFVFAMLILPSGPQDTKKVVPIGIIIILFDIIPVAFGIMWLVFRSQKFTNILSLMYRKNKAIVLIVTIIISLTFVKIYTIYYDYCLLMTSR